MSFRVLSQFFCLLSSQFEFLRFVTICVFKLSHKLGFFLLQKYFTVTTGTNVTTVTTVTIITTVTTIIAVTTVTTINIVNTSIVSVTLVLK